MELTDIRDGIDVDQLIAAGADVWAVVCNYRENTKTVSDGARAFLVWTSGGAYSMGQQQVRVRSRGGRWITKWDRVHRLTNFRAACIPVGHPMRGCREVELYPNRGAAESHAAELMMISRREATARHSRQAT